MKLEAIDPKHPSYICVCTIVRVKGTRLRLHFDGWSESYDFWTSADSPFIFHVGWCEKNGQKLHPPRSKRRTKSCVFDVLFFSIPARVTPSHLHIPWFIFSWRETGNELTTPWVFTGPVSLASNLSSTENEWMEEWLRVFFFWRFFNILDSDSVLKTTLIHDSV